MARRGPGSHRVGKDTGRQGELQGEVQAAGQTADEAGGEDGPARGEEVRHTGRGRRAAGKELRRLAEESAAARNRGG